jgi:hypothetical protein
MNTQVSIAIILAIATANIRGIAYAAPPCHPGDNVMITAVIGDVKGNLISLKPENPCHISTVIGGVRGNENAQRPASCTVGRTIHTTGTVESTGDSLNPTSIYCTG